MDHEIFEKKLMEMLLAGEDNVLNKLRKQYESAKVTSREFSNVGFYTSFSMQNEHDFSLGDKTFHIGDVDGVINGIEGAVGFILYIKNGIISLLEGYTNAIDKWPKTNDEIILLYDSGIKRDIERLKKNWM
jgi:hypothetical protein